MKFKQSVKCLFIMAIILGAQITILARESRTANPAATTTPEEVVLQWNRVLMETHAGRASVGDGFPGAQLCDHARGDVRRRQFD
jgi:hypothetical protein